MRLDIARRVVGKMGVDVGVLGVCACSGRGYHRLLWVLWWCWCEGRRFAGLRCKRWRVSWQFAVAYVIIRCLGMLSEFCFCVHFIHHRLGGRCFLLYQPYA